jgi:hypothetical protein
MSDQERRELLIEANRLFGLKGEPEEYTEFDTASQPRSIISWACW